MTRQKPVLMREDEPELGEECPFVRPGGAASGIENCQLERLHDVRNCGMEQGGRK
jgi:hypothetical protein